MITVCMNLTRTKYKSTNTTSSETTGSLFTYMYEPTRRFISKINNLRFASSRALILSLLIALVALSTGQLAHNTSKPSLLKGLFDTVLILVLCLVPLKYRVPA